MNVIKTISIVGTGNVAFHLGNGLLEQGITIVSVYGRDVAKASELANSWNCKVAESLESIESDLVLVCVSDDAVVSVISSLPNNLKVAYTSGVIDLMNFSDRTNVGVFYPLQTFSRNKTVSLFEVPFLIEADSSVFAQELFDLAWKLSRNVHFASSSDRKKYHLAAVWVNNFTNHLVYQAKNYLDKEQLNWEILLPLLAETVDKLKTLDPFEAQTGPARRNDLETIKLHEAMQNDLQKDLYSLLSKSIIDTYSKHDKL